LSLRCVISIAYSCHGDNCHPSHIAIGSQRRGGVDNIFSNPECEGKHEEGDEKDSGDELKRIVFEYRLNAVYYSRVEAIEFAYSH
jgi:hypothetical protein